MHRPILHLLTSVAVVALMPLAAIAQDVTAEPTHGTFSLTAGFRPDPPPSPTVEFAGTGYDHHTKVGSCDMYASLPPTFALNYLAGAFALTMSGWAGNNRDDDAVFFMAVHTPDGQWRCENTSTPTYTFSSPRTGKYRIWFGIPSAERRDGLTANMSFSQHSTSSDNTKILASLDTSGTARYGSVDANWLGQVISRSVEHAGGIYQVPSLGEHCSGYFNGSAPDVELNFGGGTSFFIYGGADDVRLIVNAPDGSWKCSDGKRVVGFDATWDAKGFAHEKKYRVWVGRAAPWSTPLASVDLKFGELDPDRRGRGDSF